MTDIAKKLNITLEPFCVRTGEFTGQEIQDLLDHCVDLGAEARECFKGSHESRQEYREEYGGTLWTYVGVDGDYWTWISDDSSCYDNTLSRQEALTYLKLKEEGGRLVVEDCPVSTGLVTSPETDEDGFIIWEGGDMPVEKGTMVHVKYHDGGESICTAGLCCGESGFHSIAGVWFAERWDNIGISGDIVAYKVYTEQPVEPQETISDESGANGLVEEKTPEMSQQSASEISQEIIWSKDLEETKDCPFFKEMVDLCTRYQKDMLDKRIESLENELQQAKEERGNL